MSQAATQAGGILRHAQPSKIRPNALSTSMPSSPFQVQMAHFMSTANSLSVRTLPMPEVSTLRSRPGRSARRRNPASAYQGLSFSAMINCSLLIMLIGGAERAPKRLLLNASTLTHMHRNGHGSWELWPIQQSSRKLSIVRQRSQLANSGKLVKQSAQLYGRVDRPFKATQRSSHV
jgi:hypothetical protein